MASKYQECQQDVVIDLQDEVSSQDGKSTESGRTLRPIRCLDPEGVSYDRIQFLKKRRGGYLSTLTAIYNEIDDLRSDPNNYEVIIKKQCELNFAFVNFEKASYDLIDILSEDCQKIEARAYFDKQESVRFRTEEEIRRWLSAVDELNESQIFAGDSVSQTNSLTGIGSSKDKPEDSSKRDKSHHSSQHSSSIRHSAQRSSHQSSYRSSHQSSHQSSHRSSRQSSQSSHRSSHHSSSVVKAKVSNAIAKLKLAQLKREQDLKNSLEQMKIENEIEKSALEFQLYKDEEGCRSRGKADTKQYQSTLNLQGFKSSTVKGDRVLGSAEFIPNVNALSFHPASTPFEPPPEAATDNVQPHTTDNVIDVGNVGNVVSQPSSMPFLQSIPELSPLYQPTPTLHVASSSPATEFGNAMQDIAKSIRQGMSKPSPELIYFDGNATEFPKFIRCFECNLESKTADDGEKLTYLQQYTRGPARKLIENCITLPPEQGFRKAKRLLKERYGQPYTIARAFIDQIVHGPVLKVTDRQKLLELSDLMVDCYDTLKQLGYTSDINAFDNIIKIMRRLPYQWRNQWVQRFGGKIGRVNDDAEEESEECAIIQEPTFKDVMMFVKSRSKALNHPIFSKILDDGNGVHSATRVRRSFTQDKIAATTMTTDAISRPNHSPMVSSKAAVRCPLCYSSHPLSSCVEFKGRSIDDRFKFIRSKNFCLNCISTDSHFARDCNKEAVCKHEDCKHKLKHHTLLHPLPRLRTSSYNYRKSDQQTASPTSCSEETQPKSLQCNTTAIERSGVYLQSVPIKVCNKDTGVELKTYALLDSASSACLCEERLLDILGITGQREELSLATVCGVENQTALKVSLSIIGVNGNDEVELPEVWAIKNSNIVKTRCPSKSEVEGWSHLRDLPLPDVDVNEVMVLIGSCASECFVQYESRIGEKAAPIAVRTILGWCLIGGQQDATELSQVNFTNFEDDRLSKQVEKFWHMDSYGALRDGKFGMSVEDKKALSIMKESAKLVDGHYQLKIPWKTQSSNLPNNRGLAEKRLMMLRRRFDRDTNYFNTYKSGIKDYVDSGFAMKVPPERLVSGGKRCWYLPHFGVRHAKKPTKLRIVFDCSATFEGISLNDQVLQGPDLTNSLIGVLLRFRQESIAFSGDIQGMFNQVHVHPDDYDALRFLWFREDDPHQDLEEYHMKVHLFGGVWSPSCSNFALQKTAEDNQNDYEHEVIQTVNRNFYVDDLLKSMKNSESAILMIENLRELLQRGGFRLTKFISNSVTVMQSVPEPERSKAFVNLALDDLPTERALGILWNTQLDTFEFKHDFPDKPATRRGILSAVASIYDPLGHLAVITLEPKRILQKLCRLKLAWDEVIPEDIGKQWKTWLSSLSYMERLSIPRCYCPPGFGKIVSLQLHHLSDASELGMGTASYLRLKNEHGDIHCCLLIGKSRVSPIKTLSIPRLELNAAVMAVRINQQLKEELEYVIHQVFYWTDSTTVLRYIQNESRRFQVYVANKVTEIHDGSDPGQWNYIDSKGNVADDASRGLSMKVLSPDHRWFRGPDFLWTPEDNWPTQLNKLDALNDDDPELKRVKVLQVHVTQKDVFLDTLFNRYSSWDKLKCSVAWLIKFKDYMVWKFGKSSKPPPTTRLSASDLRIAKLDVIRYIQTTAFSEDMHSLANNRNLGRSSSLLKLKPFIDGESCLRVGGRLGRSALSYQKKHQLILPYKHHVVDLIIRHYHITSGHIGRNHVLSVLRQQYWIVKGKSAVRRELSNCFGCKKANSKRAEQIMADLPSCRLQSQEPPFSRIGVDLFGPLLVKQGRSTVKRYGCIFTCLLVRAVHFEVLHSLETSSFLDGFRRFISRRGKPLEIRSDRGTNFIGSDRELRENTKEWNLQKIEGFLRQNDIDWVFNPAAASHHGGVWERLIRSTRNILRHTLQQQLVNDETLLTVLAEAESILNGRPLDSCSDDPDDLEPLTPNHLLLLRPNDNIPPGVFDESDCLSRKRWKQSQYLANIFWRRWLAEYLPQLQERQKWKTAHRNFQIGDLCLLADDNVHRGKWPLARVVKVEPGCDGLVRSVVVKTSTGEYSRPITKLCLLEQSNQNV